MTVSNVSKEDRDRAHRLGTIAGRNRRGLGGACPYNANGAPSERLLALVFVRAYVAAGGQVDGLDYGDGKPPAASPPAASSAPADPPRPDGYRGGHRAYGHLGLPL